MRKLKVLLASLLVASLSACGMFGFDDDEDGPAALIDFEAEKRFQKVWSRSIGDGQGGKYNRLTPAIDNSTIITAAANGRVVRMDLSDGDTLWSIEIEQPLLGGVGVGDTLVLLGTAKGEVIALDKETGEQRWSAFVGGEVLAAPQLANNLVYVQTFDGQMIALNDTDGSRVWSYRSTVPVLTLRGTSTPLIYRDSVIAGFASGNVVSFDAATGAVQWSTRVAVSKGNSEIERIIDIDGDFMIADGVLYTTSYQGSITALDPNSGSRIWSNEASSTVGMSEGFGNIYVTGADGSVTAFEKNGNGVRWAQTVMSRRELSGSVVQGSYVIVGDFDGYLHALSQVDGHISARTRMDSDGIHTDILSRGDLIIAYGNGGRLTAYRLN